MLAGLAISDRAQGFDFRFSKGSLRQGEIFDSATSPPARYIIEVARRMNRAFPEATHLVVGNPLLPLRAEQIAKWLPQPLAAAAIVSDAADFPLLYVLPRSVLGPRQKYLLALSGVDCDLDRRLLEALTGIEVARHRLGSLTIGSYPLTTAEGWFQGSARQAVLKVTAAHALSLIEARADWDRLPVAAFHPYHAGSIVFFAVASLDVDTPLVERHIICSSYRDIAEACGGRLEPIWLDLPHLPRDGSVGEPQYFSRSLDRLGAQVTGENFIIFMRYSRASSASPFHMIDQDRFTLGQSFERVEQLRQLQPPLRSDRCTLPPVPLKVLFQVTGGVSIKNYPLDYCKTLFRVLDRMGIVASVIGRPDLEPYGVTSIDAGETDSLTAAVRQHHVFVGLDSFPHHFVRNALGWPTVGLFGTTSARNFGGGWNAHYRDADAGLACHPCGAESRCPVYGGKECVNYARPDDLIAAVLSVAEQAYGFRPE